MPKLLPQKNAKFIAPVVIFIIGTLWFSLFMGDVSLFDWDEINFAEAAREMLLTRNYGHVQINYTTFWEKPPLFFWLQCLSMTVWGVNEFGARFPNAVVGGLTLLAIYSIGQHLYNLDKNNEHAPSNGLTGLHHNNFAIGWVLLYAGAWLPHLYFKSGIIDPLFNLFIFVGIWFGVLFYHALLEQKAVQIVYKYVFFSGAFIGLAILTKGPVGLLLSGLTLFSYSILRVYQLGKSSNVNNISLEAVKLPRLALPFMVWVLTALVVSSLWLAVELYQNGTFFIDKFIDYQIRLFSTPDSGHKQPIFYHFFVVLLGCFPLSVWALPAFFRSKNDNTTHETLDFRRVMLCLFWVVLLVFSLVKTKIVHYSSLAYLPLSYLAAWVLWGSNGVVTTVFLDKKVTYSKCKFTSFSMATLPRWVWGMFWSIGLLWVILLTSLPILAYYKSFLYPFIKDKFALACLQTHVVWGGWEWLLGVGYGLVVVLGGVLWQRWGRAVLGIRLICGAGILAVPLYLWGVVPRIEQYTQKPAIDFYKQLVGRDAYILPVGFKSYAHLFYGQIQPQNATPTLKEALSDSLQKPVYFVTKANKTKGLDTLSNVRELKQEGGFRFFVVGE